MNNNNIQDIAIERARKHYKCPYCNCEVFTVKLGESFGKKAEELKKIAKNEELKIDFFGVIYGDDRDSSFICHQCNKEFNENMEEIEYINDCLIMQSGCILKQDCKKYSSMRNKYKDYEIKGEGLCSQCKYYNKK